MATGEVMHGSCYCNCYDIIGRIGSRSTRSHSGLSVLADRGKNESITGWAGGRPTAGGPPGNLPRRHHAYSCSGSTAPHPSEWALPGVQHSCSLPNAPHPRRQTASSLTRAQVRLGKNSEATQQGSDLVQPLAWARPGALHGGKGGAGGVRHGGGER